MIYLMAAFMGVVCVQLYRIEKRLLTICRNQVKTVAITQKQTNR